MRAEALGDDDLVAPIDVKRVARSMGIEVRLDELEANTHGMFVRRLSREVILVNRHDHLHRQRFTIAHELGHAVLHAGDRVFVDYRRDARSASGAFLEEVEANAFAAELLMPAALLTECIKNVDPWENDDIVGDLARRLEVSVQALQIRVSGLGLLDLS